jgi:hypothetical protein
LSSRDCSTSASHLSQVLLTIHRQATEMVRITILACLMGSAAGSAWSDYLAGLKGDASAFDWKAACKSLGQTPSGYGMSSGGGKSTFDLKCDNNAITVVCQGTACTSSYVPPASASNTPPTGKYSVKVSGTCDHGGFSAANVQLMLDFHNKMRCAVGAPPVEWDPMLECQAQDTETKIAAFKHSKSYDLPISSGENLATGKEVAASTWMWFTEYLQGNHDFAAFSHNIGHFQAMVWKSVETIGCGVGPSDEHGKGVVRCQYSSGSGTAPNMAGAFKDNMPNHFRGTPGDFSKCGLTAAEVKAKAQLFAKWGILHPSGVEATNIGLSSLPEQPPTDSTWMHVSPASGISACAAFGAMALVAIRFVKRSAGTAQDDEGLLASDEQDGTFE